MKEGAVASRPRIPWIDAARGLAIIAVVLMHVSTWIYLPNISAGRAHDLWLSFSDWLSPVRMPTLMLISGVLLSARVRAGWRSGKLRGSVFSSWYLYVVWLSIYGLIALTGVWTGVESFESWLAQLVLPQTVLWYILALAFWAAVLATVRGTPPGLVVLLLWGISVSTFFLPGTDGVDQYLYMLRFGVFFAAGVYLRQWLLSVIDRRNTWAVGGVALGSFAALLFVAQVSSGWAVAAVIFPAEGFAAAVAVLVAARLLARVRPLRSFLVFLGRRTAPVYVMHAPLMVTLSLIPGWSDFVTTPAVKVAIPIVVAAMVITLCLLIFAGAQKTPLSALFEAPPAMKAYAVRLTRPPAVVAASASRLSRAESDGLRYDGETSS